MSNFIADVLVRSTIRMRNEWGGVGSGFLIWRQVGDGKKVFYITNKHVIHEDPQVRQQATKFFFDCNATTNGGQIQGYEYVHAARFPSGRPIWREHPNPDVDVVAMDVTEIVVTLGDRFAHKALGYGVIGDASVRDQFDVAPVGEEIVVIGYPLGITQGTSNLPIVRAGLVASHIGQILEEDINEAINGQMRTRRRQLRGFLFDGATIHGSSGSPVLLKPTNTRDVKGGMAFYEETICILLGIVAETRFAPITMGSEEYLSFAGLGLAFDAETIRETIELFFR